MPPILTTLPERRCTCCNKLLFMGIIRDGIVEIRCKCGTLNTFSAQGRDARTVDIKPDDRSCYRKAR